MDILRSQINFSGCGRCDSAEWHGKVVLLIAVLWSGLNPAHAQSLAPSAAELKRLSIEELMNIDIQVTSVSKRPENLFESASAVQVITYEQIRRSGATVLPEALRLASNLEVAQINARQWAVSARGLLTDTANQLLVMIDGRSLYMPRLAGVFWDVQDLLLENIDRIEVISGPGATLWGANAVNGVVNIITKNAKDTQGLQVSAAAGTELRHQEALRYGGRIGESDFNYRFYIKQQEHDSPVDLSGAEVHAGWRNASGGFRMDGALGEIDSLTLQGNAYRARFEQPIGGQVLALGENVLGRWSRNFSETSALALQMYFDHTSRNAPGTLRDELTTYDVDFQHRFLWNARHSIVWGASYRMYNSETVGTTAQHYIPANRTLTVFSGFIQDEIGLLQDQVKFTFGTKIEHNEYTGVEYQPSVRLAWLIDPRQNLWGAVSRAVRTPARIDREQYLPGGPPYTRIGNDTFESEELLAYELGYRVQPTQRLSLAAAAFYDDYDKVRSIERVNPAAAVPTIIGNGQQGESYGVELTADYLVTDWWRLHVADTEIRVQLRPRPGSSDVSYGANESFDPRHQFSVRSSFDLPRGWQLDASYRRISALNNQNTPAYGELDLRVAWRASEKLELSLTGQNLLHRRHWEFIAQGGIRQIERSVYGKLLWNF